MEIYDDEEPRPRPGVRPFPEWKTANAQRIIVHPTIDPERPVHIALASPWLNVVRPDRIDSIDRITWAFPDSVAAGDTVVVVVEARVPAVVNVAVAQSDSGDRNLENLHWYTGLPVAALSERVGEAFPIAPRTLRGSTATQLMNAIDAEADDPTPWWELPNDCIGPEAQEAVRSSYGWGCNACAGHDGSDSRYHPRLQDHVEPGISTAHYGNAFGVCPNCHDILHQPLGPTFDELMFSNRPACPKCHARRTFKLTTGMPVSPPPYGTYGLGCVVFADQQPSAFTCGLCDHEW